ALSVEPIGFGDYPAPLFIRARKIVRGAGGHVALFQSSAHGVKVLTHIIQIEHLTFLLLNTSGKNTVGLCQRFVRANIVPSAAHLPNTKCGSLVKPLHQAPWLIGIVAFREILSN